MSKRTDETGKGPRGAVEHSVARSEKEMTKTSLQQKISSYHSVGLRISCQNWRTNTSGTSKVWLTCFKGPLDAVQCGSPAREVSTSSATTFKPKKSRLKPCTFKWHANHVLDGHRTFAIFFAQICVILRNFRTRLAIAPNSESDVFTQNSVER